MAEAETRYIQLTPDIMHDSIWRDDGMLKLYLYCISKASHNTYKWNELTLQPGDLPLAKENAAAELEWSKNKFRRKLELLEHIGLVTVNASDKGTLIHISDWGIRTNAICRLVVHNEPSNSQAALSRSQNEPTLGAKTDPPTSEPGASQGFKMDPNKEEKNISVCEKRINAEPPGFQQFWDAYPFHRRKGRPDVVAAYADQLSRGATPRSIMDALVACCSTVDWIKQDGKYVPGMVKWLQTEPWAGYVKPVNSEEEIVWGST